MNQSKARRFYSAVMFGYGLLGIFLSMVNVLVHFQWAVSIGADILCCISMLLLSVTATIDIAFRSAKKRKIVLYGSLLVGLLALISAIGEILLLKREQCGRAALFGNLLTVILAGFYAWLHRHGDSAPLEESRKKRYRRRILMAASVAFVTICCIITPVLVTLGQRVGYPIEGQVAEQRCPFGYGMFLAAERGTLELMEYDTPFYDADGNPGQTIHKRAWVYLPYGYYDDEETQYDILYLSHGATYDENHFFNGGIGFSKFQNLFDHMIFDGMIKPMIVVTPCFYAKDEALDADGMSLTVTFQYELRNNLIPAIEEKYRTFAQTTNAEDIAASRAHRAFGGYSMGSMATLSAFEYNLDYFANYIPMSVGFGSAERLLEALNTRFEGAYDKDDYKIALCTGGRDFAYTGMVEQYYDMQNYPEYFTVDNELRTGNLCIYIGTNHRHGSEFVMEYLYVMLPKMFPAGE